MSQKLIFLMMLVFVSCAKLETNQKRPESPKEFSQGELIMGVQLLTKIYDQEMAPLACVPNVEEASLFLRTINPRMEVVQDDIEAQLDSSQEVQKLIDSCALNCTCLYIDDLLREHLVPLTKKQRKALDAKKTSKEINRCLGFIQNTFCKSELYQELEKEKVDFSFEESP